MRKRPFKFGQVKADFEIFEQKTDNEITENFQHTLESSIPEEENYDGEEQMFIPEELQYDVFDALDEDSDLNNRMMALSIGNVSEEVLKIVRENSFLGHNGRKYKRG